MQNRELGSRSMVFNSRSEGFELDASFDHFVAEVRFWVVVVRIRRTEVGGRDDVVSRGEETKY